jgi:uncharacterized protein YndB with AHSA1/START domain
VDEILTRTISLSCSVEHAFDVFTGKIDLWWPRGHRKHRDGALRLDPNALIDRAPDGTEWTMATIAEIDPPSLLRLDWYPGSPGAPTAVEIAFSGDETHADIVVTHRPLLETKSIWPQRVELFERGWTTVLPALKAFIGEE